MRVVIPQIAWHARDPVLTLDFDPKGKSEEGYYRVATGGADRLLLIWHLSNPTNLRPDIICVSELTRHQKGINVVRFSPCGNYIASGDDDAYVFIWKNESVSEKEEVWNVEKIFRRHVEDVSDLAWSPCSNYLVSGSVDNTAVLWDVKKGTPVHFWSEREHTGFVQGVAYDPLGEFSATMCIDRNLRFFSNKNGKIISKTLKYPSAWLGYEENDTKEDSPEPTSTPSLSQDNESSVQDKEISEQPKDETNNADKVEPNNLEKMESDIQERKESNNLEKMESDIVATDEPNINSEEPQDIVMEEPDNKLTEEQNDLEKENEAKNNEKEKRISKVVEQHTPAPLAELQENSLEIAAEKPDDIKLDKPTEISEDSTDKPSSEISGEDQPPTVFPLPPKRPVTTLNRLFHDDSLKTFCRRLSCSPRGELMIVPGGLLPPVEKETEKEKEEESSRQGTPVNGEEETPAQEADEEKKEGNEGDELKEKEKVSKRYDPDQNNAVIIFCRNSWSNPCAVIPTGVSYSIAAKFNPIYFERERQNYEYAPEFVDSNKRNERIISCIGKLRPAEQEHPLLLDMPYRLVFAVATNDSILICDTTSAEPLACIKNIHCTRMTDISWSADGLVLIASSTDGFCSILTFEKGELGAEFKVEGEEFPALTPNSFPIAPPEPKPIKKKEPKEPKEPKEKEPKEKKEKEPKEKKEKEPKEKKEKKEKVKDPGTASTPGTPSADGTEKKKPPTVLQMLKSAKPSTSAIASPSPSTSSPGTPTLSDKIKVAPSSQTDASPSTLTGNVTPKPTFLQSWIKKTPKSSSSESKAPRRINLINLSNSDKSKPASPSTQSGNNSTSINETSEASPQQASTKQPRRVQFVTLGADGKPKAQPGNSTSTTETSKAPPKQVSAKQPRRIELVTLDGDEEPKPKRRAIEDTVENKPVAEGSISKKSPKSSEILPAKSATLTSTTSQKAPRRITPTTIVSSSQAEKIEVKASPKQSKNPIEKIIEKLSNGPAHGVSNSIAQGSSSPTVSNGKQNSGSKSKANGTEEH